MYVSSLRFFAREKGMVVYMSAVNKLIVRAAAESQVGNARGYNEDNVYFNGDFITPKTIRQDFAIKTGESADVNCFAVLDGMGRNNTGSFASLLAAKMLDDVTDRVSFDTGRDTDEIVLDYIQNANDAIREQIRETGGVRTASTLALLVIENGVAHAYNAGDSRIYLYRDKQLIRLSRDHVQANGERAIVLTEEGTRNGGLTKYLGMSDDEGSLEPYRAKPFKVKKGDKFLVCSDGLTDYVDEEDIADCLSKRKDPFGHTNELMNMALKEDSADNISCVVVDVVEPGFHLTQNMILVALGCLIFIAGSLVGGLFGYIMGGGMSKDDTGFVGYNASDFGATQVSTVPTTVPTQQPVSGSDVSGSDVSGSDVELPDDDSSGSTTTTLYPTTTYPTATTEPIVVESMSLSVSDFTMKVGKTYTISVELYPSDIPSTAIIWKSSDPEKVSVDAYGVVKALKKTDGVKITASVGDPANGGWEESCTVRVRG